MTPKIIRLEDRQTGDVRYTLDRGQNQLLGPWYDTRQAAEQAQANDVLNKIQASNAIGEANRRAELD